MSNPKDFLYTKDHEWIQVLEGKRVRIGVTDHAQNELGDVVFVELPAEDDQVEEGEGFTVIESVKAVSDVYAPLTGTIVKVNEKLEDSPELINESPYEEGWIVELEMDDDTQLNDLMHVEEYEKFIKEA